LALTDYWLNRAWIAPSPPRRDLGQDAVGSRKGDHRAAHELLIVLRLSGDVALLERRES
jgi:hypothetical protein